MRAGTRLALNKRDMLPWLPAGNSDLGLGLEGFRALFEAQIARLPGEAGCGGTCARMGTQAQAHAAPKGRDASKSTPAAGERTLRPFSLSSKTARLAGPRKTR